jgi:hypothetical protein
MYELISWLLAIFLTFLAFFFDKKKTILLIQWLSLAFYWTHLVIIWSIASWLFLWIQAIRNIVFSRKLSKKLNIIYLVLFILVMFYIYLEKRVSDPLSWLSLIWSIFWTIACGVKNTTHVRLLFLLSSIPWLYYVIQLNSIYPIILQITFMLSNIINIIRFDILKFKN